MCRNCSIAHLATIDTLGPLLACLDDLLQLAALEQHITVLLHVAQKLDMLRRRACIIEVNKVSLAVALVFSSFLF